MRYRYSLVLATLVVFAASDASAQEATATPTPRRPTTQSVASALRAVVPVGVTVQDVREDGAEFVLAGATTTNTQLSEFLRKAMALPGLANVELRRIELGGSMHRYELAVRVDCAAPGAARTGAVCGSAPKPGAVNKCRVDGTITFQAAPCPPGSEV